MSTEKCIRIGTRESRLALVQAEMVQAAIGKREGFCTEIVAMKTTGDKILNQSLEQIGGKGLFMKELDRALAEGRTDISVHCVKDMTAELPQEYPILGVSAREDPRDVLVLPKGSSQLDRSLPVGCSSRRRILQFQKLYPEQACRSVRGNVLTRLEKLDRGEYSALLLAAAGLKRLGLEERISRYFSVEEMIPAAGQGVLAVQGRRDFDISCLTDYFDEKAFLEMTCERAFIRYLDGGCTSPIAAFARAERGRITLKGLYYEEAFSPDYVTGSMEGPESDAEKIGISLANQLQQKLRAGHQEEKK